jgi:hypothetical protein
MSHVGEQPALPQQVADDRESHKVPGGARAPLQAVRARSEQDLAEYRGPPHHCAAAALPRSRDYAASSVTAQLA